MLLTMFVSAFLAATLLPGGSEVLLVYLLEAESKQAVELVLVASIGNSLGSLTSYGLGYLGRIKAPPKHSESTASRLVSRFGSYALLLSWLPLIGDVLCVIAGYLKFPLVKSTVFIFLGKTLRYVAIAWIYLQAV